MTVLIGSWFKVPGMSEHIKKTTTVSNQLSNHLATKP